MKGPKNRGKTETIKQRSIYVYLPSNDIVNEWKNLAKKSGASVSKFVQEHVMNSLRQEKMEGYEPRIELIKKLQITKEENDKLREENRILISAYERLDE
jgi:hypothetical protein